MIKRRIGYSVGWGAEKTGDRPAATRRSFRPWFFLCVLSTVAALSARPACALVGATEDDRSFASHLVMVVSRGFDQTGFCTGVVIGPRAILTAAHCLKSIDNMRIGYRAESGDPVFVEIAKAEAHPLYRAASIAKRVVSIDMALIETRPPLGNRFSPAALDNDAAPAIGQPLKIFGYGVAREGDDKTAGALRAARLAVRGPRSPITLWAEDPNHAGTGACTGDSGGPIVSAESGKVVAITAWSAGDGHGRRCGALTQGPLVAPQSGWIVDVLKRWGER